MQDDRVRFYDDITALAQGLQLMSSHPSGQLIYRLTPEGYNWVFQRIQQEASSEVQGFVAARLKYADDTVFLLD